MREITRILGKNVGRTAATRKDLVLGVGQRDNAVVRDGLAMAAMEWREATMFTCAHKPPSPLPQNPNLAQIPGLKLSQIVQKGDKHASSLLPMKA